MINLKYIFIILILFYINQINSYIIKDVSTDNNSKLYLDYNNNCTYSYQILCIEETPSESCNKLTLNDTKYVILNSVIAKNGTSNLLSLVFTLNTPGTYSFLVNSILNLNVECRVLDLNQISFKLKGNYFIYPFSSRNYIYGVYEMIGYDPGFLSALSGKIVGSENLCFFTLLYTKFNYYYLYCLYGDFSSIKINITSYNQSKIFDLEPIVKSKNSISNIITYPDSKYLNNLNLMGYDETAILSFTLNTTIDNSYFYIDIAIPFFPISGNENSTTFLFPLTKYSNNSYSISYLSGSNYIQNPYEIKTNIIKYNLIPLPTPSILSSYTKNISIVTFGFTGVKSIDVHPINIGINGGKTLTKFPFGYKYSNNTNYQYEISSKINPGFNGHYYPIEFISSVDSSGSVISYTSNSNNSLNDSLQPSVYRYEMINLQFDTYLLRLYISTPYGFSYIDTGRVIASESRISGDTYDGIYEFIYSTFSPSSIKIYDQYLNKVVISMSSDNILNIVDQQVQRFSKPQNIQNVNLGSIKNISFLYNDIDIRFQNYYNIFYFNYSENVPRDTHFRLVPTSINPVQYSIGAQITFPSIWNDTIKLFQIEFYIEANSASGVYPFDLYSNGVVLFSGALDTQLRIKHSNVDYQGPIFTDIKKIISNSQLDSSNIISELGWSFKIQDKTNGFDWGYITITGEVDQSQYNFTFNYLNNSKSGDLYLSEYEFKINITYPCITQNYVISEVGLFDRMKRFSYFSKTPSLKNTVITNPFLNFLNDTSINKIQLQCSKDSTASNDITPPVLTSFIVSSESVTECFSFSVSFSIKDDESKIKKNYFPIVYLSNSKNQILQFKSEFDIVGNSSIDYKCSLTVPCAFSVNEEAFLSVYGFINNNGLYSGYSTNDLINLNYSHKIMVLPFGSAPSILGYEMINENSKSLLVYGKNFMTSGMSVYIKKKESSVYVLSSPTKIYNTAIIIPIEPSKYPFDIYVSSGITSSNPITITPLVYNYNLLDCNNGIPVGDVCKCYSKWTSLPNYNSQCNIPNQYISSSTQVLPNIGGEITLYGWFGSLNNDPKLFINDQLSSIISINETAIVTKIGPGKIGSVKANYTQNSIIWEGVIYPYSNNEILCPENCEINGVCNKTTGTCICNSKFTGFDCSSPITNNNDTETSVGNNGTTIIKNQDIGYLISIDSILEIDIFNRIVYQVNLTNNWIYVNKSNSITTFNQTFQNDDNTETVLQLFIEEVNDDNKQFEFAGNRFTVSKGGLKLSLSILNWSYKSNLNYLQIQLSSDISTDHSKTNQCNDETTVESSSNNIYLLNNINYLKISKNGKTLYARFQDKMLADNKPTLMTTQIIKSDELSIKIGLNLVHCTDCILDPDFSLLISSDYNNECTSSKKWVIGVIIAASFCGACLIIFSFLIIYKKSTFLKIQVYKIKKSFKNKKYNDD